MDTMRTVLTAVDLSDLSPTVLDYAASLAAAWQARLLVVHVVHDLTDFTGAFINDTPLPELQLRIEHEAQERLQALCQTTLDQQVAFETLVVTGRPVAELHQLMREQRVDCLVLGAHSLDKPEHQLFGSTAERLMQQSPCPIFMIPPRRASDFVSHG